MKNKRDLFFLGFLCILSIGGAALVYLATSRIGPGVSADGVVYLSIAASFLKGGGFVDLYGRALVLEPPLYPALLAGISSFDSNRYFDRSTIYKYGYLWIDYFCFRLIVL